MIGPTPRRLGIACLVVVGWAGVLFAQQPADEQPASPRAAVLRGEYGRYRANNDLLSYKLNVRVDPAARSIAGTNTIRFRMLRDDTRIQLDLFANLIVERIMFGATPLKYERELNAVFIDFPETLRSIRSTSSRH